MTLSQNEDNTILVVDDNPDILRLLSRICEQCAGKHCPE